jgi:hypothetical protein
MLLIIPSFLGVRHRAADKSAQAVLRVGLTNAKAIFGDSGSYSGATASALATSEPTFTWVNGDTVASTVRTASVQVTKKSWTGASPSGSTCFFIRDDGSVTTFAKVQTADCRASSAPAQMGPSW